MKTNIQASATTKSLFIPVKLILGGFLIASCFCACGSAGDNHGFGVSDDLEENEDDFVRLPFGSTTDEDPVFPDGRTPVIVSSDDSSSNDSGSDDPPFAANSSSGVITAFLWKPESSRDGNLAVLVNLPNISIRVAGSEYLTDTSVGTSRGTTGRGRKSGCDYGDDVLVEFFNSRGQRVRLRDGRQSVTIADGCRRVEFSL